MLFSEKFNSSVPFLKLGDSVADSVDDSVTAFSTISHSS